MAGEPEEAAKVARYALKSVAYSLKGVDTTTGDVTPATHELMQWAREVFRCSSDCVGIDCRAKIHEDLAGSERPLSYSRNWSVTALTRTKIREQRAAYMEAMAAEGNITKRSSPGMTEEELWRSKHARRWRREVERQRQAEARERWEEAQYAEQPEAIPRT